MKGYFKPALEYRKTYWKFWTSLPTEIYDWTKYFLQRGSRGYADNDCWSIDTYLCEVIPEMLKHLKKDIHGHPASLNSMEEWSEILDKIIAGFEAAKKLNDLENWPLNKGNEMVTAPDEENPNLRKISWTNPWSKEQIEHFRKLDEKDKKTFDEGMKLFSEYFFNLWD